MIFNLRNIIFFFILLTISKLQAQDIDSINRKRITIPRITTEAPKIDGVLDDIAWQNAPIATNFVERFPNNGKPIPDSLRTEVKIIYNDLGIYFGATMYDPQVANIPQELTERDNIDNDDFFFILLNGYNDRQQSLQFIVTAAGVQYDAKMTNGSEDSSWNGVWYSDFKINADNWVTEIFIPYSEIRFPKKNEHVWGLNMEREYRRTRSRYSWSHVDNTKGAFSTYDGEIYGIKNIQSPTRLSFQPYISSYFNDVDGKSDVTVNGGLDLKYGINDAFTLDMILIPDFGQTKFDETVLNLSAFEVQYNEQRPFFNEGTELFNKGNLFYSRRIGGAPSGNVTLSDNEEITEYPASVGLINAIKVSGRTSKNLGIGVFNAVTKKSFAEVYNNQTKTTRNALVAPNTNYNVLVFDQRFGDNNSISLVNTSTLREGHYRDANVGGLYFDITNKSKTINYWGNVEGSWVMQDNTKFGTEASAAIAKISGKHRLQGSFLLQTKDYNINDLGYSGGVNYINYYAYYGYRYLQPKGFLNNLNLNFNINYTRRLEPDLYNNFSINFNSSFTTKKFLSFGGGFETTPFKTNDIYEPRVEGLFVKIPTYYNPWIWISTNYNKKLALDVTVDWYKYNQHGRGKLSLDFGPRYRVSDKWKLYYNAGVSLSDKEQGFVNFKNDDIIFGERNRNTITNTLESEYIFNNSMALSFAFRHYFSDVTYDTFLTLNKKDGSLITNNTYNNNHDTTYNSWNIDLRYSWWFAPGSQLTFLYRNAIESFVNQSDKSFNENFNDLFNQPQINSLSIRVSYFLDYNRVKRIFNKNNATPMSPDKMSYHDIKALRYKQSSQL